MVSVWKLANRKMLARTLPRHAVVAEVGVQRGRFAKVILQQAKPAALHLIDCWQHQDDDKYEADMANTTDQHHLRNLARTRQRLRRGVRQGRVVIHQGFSVPMLATFSDHFFDWIYIDANHTCESVRADLEACLSKVRPGGIIAGHDYINTTYWKDLNYGVVEAVDEFCAEHNWEIIYLTREPGNEINGRGNPSYALRQAGWAADETVQRPWWMRWAA